jgi:5-methylcytosine-specific restriction endonuclease McrA
MFIFYKELSLDEGFKVLKAHREDREVDGQKVSAPSGVALWKTCRETNAPLKCWHCGVEADRFIVKHHKNDQNKRPVLELFAHTGKSLVMMTRDHIVPVSLGGLNDVKNLRPGCETCNGKRKSIMNKEDQEFMDKNKHLWVAKRPARGSANAGMGTPYDQGYASGVRGEPFEQIYDQRGEELERDAYKQGYENGIKMTERIGKNGSL